MPVMDGLEATRRIRAFEQAQRRKPVPVIALSASVLEQDRRNARAAGMDGFASKPLEPAGSVTTAVHTMPDTRLKLPSVPAVIWMSLSVKVSPMSVLKVKVKFTADVATAALTLWLMTSVGSLPTTTVSISWPKLLMYLTKLSGQ